jgi:hypothetical protein
MKRIGVLSLVVVAALALSGIAYAQMWGGEGNGPGYGMGPGMMYGYGTGNTVNIEKFKQFRKETSALREDLAVKQIELNGEYNKEKPDTERVTTLQKDILDLRAKIAKAAEKAGLESTGGWGRHRGYYGMGPGMMYGGGYGYGCGW